MLNLIKINLTFFFDIHKIINAKTTKERLINITKFIIILAVYIGLGIAAYKYFEFMFEGYKVLKIESSLLHFSFAAVSSMMLFTTIYKAGGLLFNNKDFDMILSLPIKRYKYILSKLITLYLLNMIYALLIMIPSLLIYVKNVKVDLIFYIYYLITFLIMPLLPMIVATIIGSLISTISSRFKNRNIVNIALTLSLFVGVILLSSELENMPVIDIANASNSFLQIFNKVYPLTILYNNIIINKDILSLLLFILIPVSLFIIYIVIINKYFIEINNRLKKEVKNDEYEMEELNINSPVIALYKKEVGRYFSSPNYILNTMIGSIMLIITIVVYIFIGGEKVELILGTPGIVELIERHTPLVIATFNLLTCTTHPSISLEGKNAWIMKTIPVNPVTIFLSKILLNLTISVPSILISSLLISLYLKLTIKTFIFTCVLSILYSCFVAMFGIIINMCFVNFNWKNEISVIKQSLPAFICIILPLLLGVLPFFLEYKKNTIYLIVFSAALLLNIICIIILNTISKKQFKELNC